MKSRYSVWPSAYASGALVKCRKKGAKNWGNSSKKEEVEYDIDEGWGAAAKVALKTVGKQAVRQGIKVGGKTGGKIVKNVIKHGGDELKNQAIQTAGDVAVNTVKKIGDKTRQKVTPNEDVQEMVGNQAAAKSAERQAMRKLKKQNKMKQVMANRIITKDNEQDAKLQKKLAKIQMSSFSNWRDELELIDENRMAAYNAGAGEGNEDRGISKSLADKMGRYNDESAFSRRKTSGKFNKDYNKNVLKDKKPRSNTTGRGTPQQYRKGYEDSEMGRYQSKIVQGKGSIKDLGKKK